jgi:hypothetical protein
MPFLHALLQIEESVRWPGPHGEHKVSYLPSITLLKNEAGTQGRRDNKRILVVVQVKKCLKEGKTGAKEALPMYLHEQTKWWLKEARTELDRRSQISTHPLNEVRDEKRTNEKKIETKYNRREKK